MRIDGTFVHSKLGRRIFGVFICCSLIPIGVFSFLSFKQVMQQLEVQSHRRLQQSAKAVGMSIFERLVSLDSEMRKVGLEIKMNAQVSMPYHAVVTEDDEATRFKAMAVWRGDAAPVQLFGFMPTLPPLAAEDRLDLTVGKTGVIVQHDSSLTPHVILVRPLDPADPQAGFLVGEINTHYLWSIGPDNTLPPMTDLCILDSHKRFIISSIPDSAPLLARLASLPGDSGSRQFEWEHEGVEHVASHWTIFMKARFAAPNWTVVLSQSKEDVFAPLRDFGKIFPLVILASVLVVTFLSMYYIRMTLVPLETIKAGIRQISKRDFDTRIQVTSGDEFEEVAATINDMSTQLGRQFRALTTMAEIDRTALSSLDTEKIIATALTGMQSFFSCDMISINLMDPKQADAALSYLTSRDWEVERGVRSVTFRPQELQMFHESREHLMVHFDAAVPSFLAPFTGKGVRACLVLPVFVQEKLGATVNIGYVNCASPSAEDLIHARQLANQIAIALSSSSLMEELDQLNWGTLKALARTVDAKSPWTAGHSERVTELALSTARTLGLLGQELDDLHRGAFLHDIGKVGVRSSILDKPGKLTPEEYEIIKEHPRIGARILEPIAAYRSVIPIVLQHHERYDGKGYPDGLGGDDIHKGARIIAVADVYDAMLAKRPYRSGLRLEDVVDYIRTTAGSQFDPEVVDAFLVTVFQTGPLPEKR